MTGSRIYVPTPDTGITTSQSKTPLDGTPYESINTSQHVALPDGTQPIAMGSGIISRILGEGGVAIVYEINNERLGIKRAVKVLKPNASIQSLGRFETEMRITAQLHHPHVVEIHSVGDWNGLPFIEMELISGVSLDKIIKERGALPLPMVLAVGIMVCRALEFTHNHTYRMENREFKGILHRDLKPANIMVATDGVVKLTDFGIARPTEISLHTMEGDFVGSLQYVSPEQLHGKPLDARADIFSLGCVLYEMITGVKAFPEVNVALLATSRLKNHYRALRDVHTKIPRSLSKIVQECLAFDQADRCATVTPVRTELERLLAQITSVRPEEVVEYFTANTSSRRVLAFKRPVPPVVFALAGGAVALLAAVGILITMIGMPDKPAPAPAVDVVPRQTDTVVVTKTDTVRLAPPAQTPPPLTRRTRTKSPAPAPIRARTIEEKLKVPQKTAAPSPSFLDQLYTTYQANDLPTIISGELSKGNHAKALEILTRILPGTLPRTTAVIFQARALEGLKRTAALKSLLQQAGDVSDAELLIMGARIAIQEGRYPEALDLLKTSAGADASLLPKDSIEHSVIYYTATCKTGVFHKDSSAENRQTALDSWFSVKYALRSAKNHPYFTEANKEIRLLTP